MIVYGHWIERAVPFALGLGLRGGWHNPDTDGATLLEACRADAGFRFIFNPFFIQVRLLDTGGTWQREMTHAVTWLVEQDLVDRCAAIQFDDEWWSALAGTRLVNDPGHWPALVGLSLAQRWALRHQAAQAFVARARQLRTIWRLTGRPCPPIGMAESGAVLPPEFEGQEWWGVNAYYLPGKDYSPTAAGVQRLYDAVWAVTRLPVQPVVGIFQEPGTTLPPLEALASCYWPILQHPRVWSVGLFAVHHPTQYDPRHGPPAQGVRELPAGYADGVRALCAAVAARVGVFDTTRQT